ncbi:MAG: dienelactone hydrolase family protein [Sneathiella sp.]|nr:dienelactone hydrolase family protein [Sneathiella sp.]
MGNMVTLKTNDGHSLSAYVAEATHDLKGGIVLIQEIFGINAHIKDVCDRYAKHGYTTIAPALFDRIEPKIDLDYDSDGVAKGVDLKGKCSEDLALADIAAAQDHIKSLGTISIIGYCWGGTLAYLAACKLSGFSKAISYYGGGVAKLKDEQPQIPLMMHFGDQDTSIPMTDVDAIMTARPESKIFIYQAGHGFNCDRRSSYDANASKVALERSLHFIAGD